MPDLRQTIFNLFADVSEKYSQSKTKVGEFAKAKPWAAAIGSIFSSQIAHGTQLGDDKRKEFAKLREMFRLSSQRRDSDLSSSMQFLEEMRALSNSRASGITETSDQPKNSDYINQTPKVKYFEQAHNKVHDLYSKVKKIEQELGTLSELRAKHGIKTVGQSEGILNAMRRSLFCLMRIYNRKARYLLDDIDTDLVHPKMQWINFAAFILCVAAYDFELAKYAESKEGHPIDPEYYLGTGIQNLPIESRQSIFAGLDAKVQMLCINYTLHTIFSIKLKNDNTDVEPYIEKLQKIIEEKNRETEKGDVKKYQVLSDFQNALISLITSGAIISPTALQTEIMQLQWEFEYVLGLLKTDLGFNKADHKLPLKTGHETYGNNRGSKYTALDMADSLQRYAPVENLNLRIGYIIPEPKIQTKTNMHEQEFSYTKVVPEIFIQEAERISRVQTVLAEIKTQNDQDKNINESAEKLLEEGDLIAAEEVMKQLAQMEQSVDGSSPRLVHRVTDDAWNGSVDDAGSEETEEVKLPTHKSTGEQIIRAQAPGPLEDMSTSVCIPMQRQSPWLHQYEHEKAASKQSTSLSVIRRLGDEAESMDQLLKDTLSLRLGAH